MAMTGIKRLSQDGWIGFEAKFTFIYVSRFNECVTRLKVDM